MPAYRHLVWSNNHLQLELRTPGSTQINGQGDQVMATSDVSHRYEVLRT